MCVLTSTAKRSGSLVGRPIYMMIFTEIATCHINFKFVYTYRLLLCVEYMYVQVYMCVTCVHGCDVCAQHIDDR